MTHSSSAFTLKLISAHYLCCLQARVRVTADLEWTDANYKEYGRVAMSDFYFVTVGWALLLLKAKQKNKTINFNIVIETR